MHEIHIFNPVCLGIISGTGYKKNTPKPVIEEEYYSFDTNGVHYNYLQETRPNYLSGGYTYTLGAVKPSGFLGYQITAHWLDESVKRGKFEFRLGGYGISKDTIKLSTVYIYDFYRFYNNTYKLTPPYTDRMIFTERSTTALRGTFERQAAKTTGDTLGFDSVLNITNGNFYIIPQQ